MSSVSLHEETNHYQSYFFFFNDTATTEIYTLSLHDALPIFGQDLQGHRAVEHLHAGAPGRRPQRLQRAGAEPRRADDAARIARAGELDAPVAPGVLERQAEPLEEGDLVDRPLGEQAEPLGALEPAPDRLEVRGVGGGGVGVGHRPVHHRGLDLRVDG